MLVTHDAELAALADSRLVLRDGRPVESESRIPLDSARGEPDPASRPGAARLEPTR
jgi:ABC-type taurine transport system ATPase subunit